jgi:hypothetical protein
VWYLDHTPQQDVIERSVWSKIRESHCWTRLRRVSSPGRTRK